MDAWISRHDPEQYAFVLFLYRQVKQPVTVFSCVILLLMRHSLMGLNLLNCLPSETPRAVWGLLTTISAKVKQMECVAVVVMRKIISTNH